MMSLSAAAEPDWEDTLERVKPAIVSIRMNVTRSFDTETARFSYATGFVVDAERGIILTNRHVVQPGPLVAEAILANNEELSLTALYRDPVHDFGFFQFDPDEVQFMSLVELPLHPEAVQLDADIRIIGNDAGEQGAILTGTLSRLDRDAPSYGRGNYNDFNTFYIQSASGTSGGSSGSPVLDIYGRVVALNAGSKRSSASSYFLPLDRIVSALTFLQAEEVVPRGTMQTTFSYVAYDELRRRRLQSDTEVRFRERFPDGTGMLVVRKIVPRSPASQLLKPGDILVAVNGEPLTHFVKLEAALDGAVGDALTLSIQRNGQAMDIAVPVSDLHAITPSRFFQVGNAILNDLSYQKAMSFAVPLRGVSVTSPGYGLSTAGVMTDAIIFEADGQPIQTIDDLEAVFSKVPDGERSLVRFYHPNNPSRVLVSAVEMEREWFPMQLCERDDQTGYWPCVQSEPAPAGEALTPRSTTYPVPPDRVARKLAPSLVMVDFDAPYRSDGVYGRYFRGTGLILDAAAGLVVVDRDTVPVMIGEVGLTFAGSLEVPGEVVWLHPEHNLALVQYDPALIGDTPVKSATLRTDPVVEGERIWQVGLSGDEQVVWRETVVERIRPAVVPIPQTPFFRESNVSLIDPQEIVPSLGGVLVDKKGRVRASWASFVDLSGEPDARLHGLPADIIAEAHSSWQSETWQSFGIEFTELGLAAARRRGLGDAQAVLLEAHDDRRKALQVARIRPDAPAASLLRPGDILLSIDGVPVTRFREVDAARAQDSVLFEVFRGDGLVSVAVSTLTLSTSGADRIIGWAGAMFQETPDWVAIQRGIVPEGVYVSWYWYGSPAAKHNLRGTRRIIAVNGEAVDSLDTFLDKVSVFKDKDTVQLTTLRLDGQESILTMQLDMHYWPTYEIVRGDDGWRRVARE
jgi:S1-C subfamily serine protease